MAHRLTDLTGQRFGSRTVLGPAAQRTGDGRVQWRTRCDCGQERICRTRDVKRSKACRNCVVMPGAVTHGMSRHPAFHVWDSMRARCHNPQHQAWHNYGARGIRVCNRWRKSFESFWADMGLTYQRGLDLDRIDNNKGYRPGNCRWVTRKVNARNKRTNRIINTPLGLMTVAEAAERSGIGVTTLHYRLRHNVPTRLLFATADVRNRFTTL